MERYSIYCTEEHTKKAFALGAPIDFKCHKVLYLDGGYSYEIEENDGEPVLEAPTAEQMIGWLENNGFYFSINTIGGSVEIDFDCIYENHSISRKGATLAAIDAALDYLIKNK